MGPVYFIIKVLEELNKNYLQITSLLEPLIQIQNNFA